MFPPSPHPLVAAAPPPAGADDGAAPPMAYLHAAERGAVAANGKPSLDIVEAGLRLIGYQPGWSNTLGQGVTVTYGYRGTAPAALPGGVDGFKAFSAAQIAQTELALQAWADVANIRFVRLGLDQVYSDSATILFGAYTGGQAGVAAFAYGPGRYPGGLEGASAAGDVWINAALPYNAAPTGANYGGQVLIHEIGHTIGLEHPSSYDAQDGADLSYAAHAGHYEDSRQYTVMSYFAERNTGADFGGRFAAAPLLDDIKAAQLAYGPNLATRAGDTVYGFNATAARPWLAASSATDKLVFAIWDAGGTDTLDLSGFLQPQRIDLRAGHFSDVGGLVGNIAVADGVVVENARGGMGADRLVGNPAANHLAGGAGGDTLTGGGGDDRLDGGDGADVAVLGGDFGAYRVEDAPTGGLLTIDLRPGAPDGSDLLTAVESIRFGELLVSTGAPIGGVLQAAYVNILRAEPIGAKALLVNYLNAAVASAQLTSEGALEPIVRAADATTTVATLAYQFFTGRVPTLAGLDYLVSPTGPNPHNLNSPYYQGFNLENRFINFAVNLGKWGEGAAAFAADFGQLTLTDATRTAYREIFGSTPSEGKLHDLLDAALTLGGQSITRSDYFAFYGQDGADGLGSKAAMVGWLLAEAAKADVGVYSLANDALLADLADGAALGVDLVGLYTRPEHVFHGD